MGLQNEYVCAAVWHHGAVIWTTSPPHCRMDSITPLLGMKEIGGIGERAPLQRRNQLYPKTLVEVQYCHFKWQVCKEK